MPANQVNAQYRYRFVRTLAVFVIIALLTQMIGFMGPGWIVLDDSSSLSLLIGIWFAVVCEQDLCKAVSMTNYVPNTANLDVSNWLRYQVLTTAGMSLGLMTLIVLTCSRRKSGCFMFGIVSGLTLISGVCAIVPAVLVGIYLINTEELVTGDTSLKFPWALLLTGVGGIVSILNMFLSICFSAKSRSRGLQNHRNTMQNINQESSRTYLGGANYNHGFSSTAYGSQASSPMYTQPTHVSQNRSVVGGNDLYPNLNTYGQDNGRGFVQRENPVLVPSAPPLEML